MNSMQTNGLVTNGSLCTALEGVKIICYNGAGQKMEDIFTDELGRWQLSENQAVQRVCFQLNGYAPKSYRMGELPEVVRLLDDQLIGYQKRLWFKAGETVETYIHAPVSYTGSLFRHGYQKECILDFGNFEKQCQILPDGYFVDTGLNWESRFSYTIPENARPGLYSLLLEDVSGESFAIPMIVSTDSVKYGYDSKLLVLASTNTWQSYNLWGGRSRYRNFEENLTEDFISPVPDSIHFLKTISRSLIPESVRTFINKRLEKLEPAANWKFKRLSIQRPFTNCRLEEKDPFGPFTNHLAAGEWRLLAWLEREGYPYDIVSGFELHQNPEMLSNYKTLILNTHSEYWSSDMFRGLKAYHEENAGWILNISGNSIFREIEFYQDGSTRCVSLSFKDSCADESQILGVRFDMSDYATCAPFKIMKPNHWIFKDIPICKSAMFGGLSLNQNTKRPDMRYDPGRPGLENSLDGVGASGWETDKLCKSAPPDITVVAKGLNRSGGADMVFREPASNRGGMFSASSLLFSGCLLIDNSASLMMKNVLKAALQ